MPKENGNYDGFIHKKMIFSWAVRQLLKGSNKKERGKKRTLFFLKDKDEYANFLYNRKEVWIEEHLKDEWKRWMGTS